MSADVSLPVPASVSACVPAPPAADTPVPDRRGLAALTLGAVGIVYGDIGTSPLYTMKEVFGPAGGLRPDTPTIVGAVSTVVWSLMLVVTLKYVTLILRADNRGEGGIMALTALAASAAGRTPRRRAFLLLTGVLGAALFYGDSVITPAISVLSAVEGLEIATPALKPYVLPIALVVLAALFAVQRFGTETVGRAFGPVLAAWFVLLGAAGAVHVAARPEVLAALNPWCAIAFLHERGWHLFVVMGSIVLALTGAEALYADMGHFGKRPIRWAWNGLVLPALALNYLGQGALLIGDASARDNPFFRLFPGDWMLPVVLLATAATVIAAQAVISGAFSMTRQAIQLGFLPRLSTVHTSAREAGQIYMPQVNAVLFGAVTLAVLGFGSSSALASAYGIAVTVTMLITTLLTYFVLRDGWGWRLPAALAAIAVFLAVDAVFVVACMLKFFDGGWFPLLLGAAAFAVMTTWARGRELLAHGLGSADPALVPLVAALAVDASIHRASRTAVYAVASEATAPQALLHNLKHNQVLHERNVVLTVHFHERPWIGEAGRVEVAALGPGFWHVRVNYGFKDVPDVPHALALAAAHGLAIDPFETTYFLSRSIVVPVPGTAGMAPWRDLMFAVMARNAGTAAEYFRLPINAVVELGTRVAI